MIGRLPLLALLTAVCLPPAASRAAEELQRLEGVVLLANAANDGDSFRVRAGERELALRLYFVDCCETAAGTDSDARRVREQMRYFGLPDAQRTLAFGAAAKESSAKALARPFTVHTAYARALGRSATPRIYALVTTAAGEDLAALLVREGLARAKGIGRAMPDGTSRDEQEQRLRDLEASAMLKRTGIWGETNPDRLAELRAEAQELEAFIEPPAPAAGDTGALLDVNTATREQLGTVPGLRADWIEPILAGRPYARLEDLLRIRGIGPKTIEKLRERLTVRP
jgi:competence protein ComEA